MNIRSTIKTLPLIGVLALGLVLSPMTAMADQSDRGSHKGQYSHDNSKKHNKAHKNARPHKVHEYDRRGHKHAGNKHYDKRYSRHNKHSNNKHFRHSHRDKHRHGSRRHSHSYYVVNDHRHHDHYIDFDDLRFMIGLHTDNFDIIFRD